MKRPLWGISLLFILSYPSHQISLLLPAEWKQVHYFWQLGRLGWFFGMSGYRKVVSDTDQWPWWDLWRHWLFNSIMHHFNLNTRHSDVPFFQGIVQVTVPLSKYRNYSFFPFLFQLLELLLFRSFFSSFTHTYQMENQPLKCWLSIFWT